MPDIRDIDGLWCDDITFCPEQCGWKDCPRNYQNIRDRTIPHSFSVEIPQDCPKRKRQEDVSEILNCINDVLDEMGYEAVGYDNTGEFLCVLVDKK